MKTYWTSDSPIELGNDLLWTELNTLDWVQNLKEVPQSPIHHAEGDVWIHTKMVMEALLELPEFQNLPKEKQAILFWATLAHDISKPECTTIDANGEISSPRHAVKGRQRFRREVFWGNPGGIPFKAREEIVQLIRYHGLPLWFFERPDFQAMVIKASVLCDMQLLALLAEADVRGRICADKNELLDRVELFREYCMELGVWEGPYPFANNFARFSYFQRPENGPQYVPFDDLRAPAILLSGLPGSGKDTWIKNQNLGYPVISLDALRIEMGISPKDNQGQVVQAAKNKAKAFLRNGEPFIWNATNLVHSSRQQLVSMFQEYKARTKIVHIEVPYAQMQRQNADRKAKVPEKVIRKMTFKWEVAECWEAPEVEYAISE